MRTLRTVLALATFVLLGVVASGWSGVTAEQTAQYRELRKGFLLAIALTPDQGSKPRREHARYLRKVAGFVAELGDGNPGHAAGAEYMRGRVLLKIGQEQGGRDCLDRCLAKIAQARQADEELPLGLPRECSIRIVRALSFLGKGSAKVLEELEAIPKDIAKPEFHEVGEPLAAWADALETRKEDAAALRAYLLIKHWELWEEQTDKPDRKIESIRYRTGNPAPAAAENEK